MSRKRTNLDRAEADYLYAATLLEFSRNNLFQDLSIPERNSLIDKVCIDAATQSCKNKDHIDAVMQEILSYRLSKEDEVKFYDVSQYTDGLEKPENFNELLKKKYLNLISEFVSEVFV